MKLAWDAIVHGEGTVCAMEPSEAIAPLYDQGTTDEFLPPLVFSPHTETGLRVRNGDVVFFFNFRADRARELSDAFLQPDFAGFDRGAIPKVHFVTLTQYDAKYACPHAFEPQTLNQILGEVVAAAGKRQLRIAETEKYPHVTYFFNGGVEQPNIGEESQDCAFTKGRDLRFATGDERRGRDGGGVGRITQLRPGGAELCQPGHVGHTGVVSCHQSGGND